MKGFKSQTPFQIENILNKIFLYPFILNLYIHEKIKKNQPRKGKITVTAYRKFSFIVTSNIFCINGWHLYNSFMCPLVMFFLHLCHDICYETKEEETKIFITNCNEM